MTISPIDAGEYFRGLLLLTRKDHKISDAEAELMRRIGKSLGFEREFCEDAIRDILENKYILDMPPQFSAGELAMSFIKDGLTLAYSDQEIPASEEEWLMSVAAKNGLDNEWFNRELENASMRKDGHVHLEADNFSVEYS